MQIKPGGEAGERRESKTDSFFMKDAANEFLLSLAWRNLREDWV